MRPALRSVVRKAFSPIATDGRLSLSFQGPLGNLNSTSFTTPSLHLHFDRPFSTQQATTIKKAKPSRSKEEVQQQRAPDSGAPKKRGKRPSATLALLKSRAEALKAHEAKAEAAKLPWKIRAAA